jgi:hypothetical protein
LWRSEKLEEGTASCNALWALNLGAGLFGGFLPCEWRHAIDEQFEQIFPCRVYAPHPDMDLELGMDFRQHPRHWLIEFAILGVLTIADAYLILRVWRAIRKSATGPPA